MFEELEQLAKDNKKISDFHIRSGSPLAYIQTGEIIKVQDVMVTAQDLKDLLSMNCNEHELEKFNKTHELDTSVTLSGLRFRANFYKTIKGPACVCRRVESKIPEMDQFSFFVHPILFPALIVFYSPFFGGRDISNWSIKPNV